MRRLRPAAPLGISIGDRCARGGRRARSDAAPSLRRASRVTDTVVLRPCWRVPWRVRVDVDVADTAQHLA